MRRLFITPNDPAKVEGIVPLIAPTREAVYVPLETRPHFKALRCFLNVRDQVEACGGGLQCGWTIKLWPRVMVQAEFHAVWLEPGGRLVDVTPNDQDGERILFRPDDGRTWSGRLVPSVFLPLTQDPDAVRLIELSNKSAELLNSAATRENEMRFARTSREITATMRRLAARHPVG